ncbi:hypothetical protein [Enterobacter hormaechei]|uniref:hypothetical protein n=1 Tax=Enterobacter hormaechei TaxID=158836 RepID=UPI002FF06175
MTANKPMTSEQLDEMMAVAVNMQRDSEKAGDRPSAMFAYAVQVAVLELRKVRDDASALASLEAEPVAFRSKLKHPSAIGSERWDYADHRQPDAFELENCIIERLYTASPAQANAEPVAWLWSHRKHPSEVTLVRPEDDERAEGAHWSGWSCQALYAAQPAPVSVPDEVCWEDVPEEITEDDMALASAWAHGFNQCRAAMLKHSEPFIVTSDHRMMEMPQVEAINAVTAMLQGVENAETPTTMQTAPALDSSPKIAELPSGNSPVIPDGWVLVPEEPTHEMLEAGDEQFGTYDVYRRMIAASPQQEVK